MDQMEFMGANKSVAAAWLKGQRQMMRETTAALNGGILVGKDAAELGDHVNAVLHEGCSSNNGTITLLRQLARQAQSAGERQLYQCHTTRAINEGIVAAFLIGAGRDHYLASGGWSNGAGSDHWSPLLDMPLGEPAADAIYNPATTNWTRVFGSGTRVTFNATSGEGNVVWGRQGPG